MNDIISNSEIENVHLETKTWKSQPSFNQRYEPVRSKLFEMLVVGSALGNILDMVFVSEHFVSFALNTVNVMISFIGFFLYKTKSFSLKSASILLFYVIVLNLIVSLTLRETNSEFIAFVFRISLVVGAFLPFMAFMVGKVHAVFMGMIGITSYIYFGAQDGSSFLLASLPLVVVIFVVLTSASYYLIDLLHRAHEEQGVLIANLESQQNRIRRNNKELKAAIADKDRLFSILAHDLKNPIGNIITLSGLMAENIHNKEHDDLVRIVDIISQSSKQSLLLLSNLLEWSRSQTGRIKFAPAWVHLFKKVEEIIKLEAGRLAEKNLDFHNDVPMDLLVRADESMLKVILMNLISNAIKYSKPEGTIYVTAHVVASEFSIEVRDSGVGMDEKLVKANLSGEHSASQSGTFSEQGSGLGLLLVRDFVARHKGRFELESKPNLGTTARIFLPEIQT